MSKFIQYFSFLFIVVLLFSSCEKDEFCTEEFYINTIIVSDSLNNPVFLDAYYTIRKGTIDTIVKSTDGSGVFVSSDSTTTSYLFFPDATNYTTEAGNQFEVIGIKNNNVVFTEEYAVNHDGCHVKGENIVGPKPIIANL